MANTESTLRRKFISGLRQLYRWYWPAKKDCIGKNRYKVEGERRYFIDCAICGKRLTLDEVEIDHIEPVGLQPDLIAGEIGPYCDRLFCDVDNLQPLCPACHLVKCNQERVVNVANRKKVKFKIKEPTEKQLCQLNQTSRTLTKRAGNRGKSKRKH